MEKVLVQVLAGLLVAIVSSLVTHQLTSRGVREQVEARAREVVSAALAVHEAGTAATIASLATSFVEKHEKVCGSRVVADISSLYEAVDRIRMALVFLVTKNGGNPSELGLDRG